MRRFFAKKGSGAYPIIKPAVPPARVILVRLLAHATVSDRHLPFQSSRSRQSYRVVGGGADPVDGPLRPTARLSAIGTFARSTRARQANRFAERPEFCDQYARDRGSAETVPSSSRRALPGRKLQFTNPFISSPTTKTP
jgi:hypothetical protein